MADKSSLGTEDTVMVRISDADLSMVLGGQIVAGRYEILGLIGAGGMGRVYKARDRELDEVIALKVLHRDLLGSESALLRFRQEVKLARRVTHRNVARTFDIGEHDEERFLTMELVEGDSLSTLLSSRGWLGVAETVALAQQICAGMSAAHAAGVVHRDLKPDNLLVAADGRVVITDFGIARGHVPGDAGKTSGQAVGTPTYMAPEQVEARTDIDARADIYALGCVLYEALTGQRAWPGEAPYVVAMARLLGPPPDARALRADLPAALAEVLVRAMARDRGSRFESAEAFARALLLSVPAEAAETKDATPPPASVPLTAARLTSVAVLPFRNIGPQEDGYVAEGLTEDLLDALSTVRGLRVRARGLAAPSGDAAQDGRKLGVEVVVDGSVRRTREGFRVSARLVGAEDGFQIWAARFERPVGEAFALNDEVAAAIANALSASVQAPQRAALADPVALDLYLRGRQEMARHWIESKSTAVELLTAAVARAPNDPTILSAYVSAHLRHSFLREDGTPELRSVIERALTAAPQQGEPWVALAMWRWNAADDPVGAIHAIKRALLNAPNLAEANDQAGRLLLEVGLIEEATVLLERALWVDAMLPWARLDLMRAAAYQRKWTRLADLHEARVDQEWRKQARISLLRRLLWRGDVSELDKLPPDAGDERSAVMAKIFEESLRSGVLSERARRFLRKTIEPLPLRARGRRLFAQLATELHVFAEDDDEARRYLGLAVEAGIIDLGWLDHNPLLRRYHGQAWFEAARAEVRERAEQIVAAWRGPLLDDPGL